MNCIHLNDVVKTTKCGNVYEQCYDCGRISAHLSIDVVIKMIINNEIEKCKYLFNSEEIMYNYLDRYVYNVLRYGLKRIEPNLMLKNWKKKEIIDYIIRITFIENSIKGIC